MKKPVQIFKFGGASIKSADNIRNVASILKRYADESLVVVVSAMGSTTNQLEKVVEAHHEQTGTATELLEQLKDWHYGIMDELFGGDRSLEVYASVNDTFVEVEWVLDEPPHENYDYMYDQIVCVGELVSSKIVAAFLNAEGLPSAWLDARDVIRTDDLYREGWVIWDETVERAQQYLRPLTEQDGFVITQGFIGSTAENATTTLGREGSDYTAAILSYCIDAKSMTIWKDVPGILTADPRIFENVTKLDRLSYREAIEMTYYGAKVIHPKTIKPLQNKSIPLFVKSFLNPNGDGTYISDEVEDNYPTMVMVEPNQSLLHVSTRDFSFVAEHHLSHLFQQIAEHRLQVNMMQNSAISFAVCVNTIDDRVDRFAASLQADFKVSIERGLELITIRHADKSMVEALTQGKLVLMEERVRRMVQVVVKDMLEMKRKENIAAYSHK